MSIIGRRVLRVGRTTGLRRGTIVAFGCEFIDDKDTTAYTDLLIVGDNNIPFSTHGDSGSLIVLDNDEWNPIGSAMGRVAGKITSWLYQGILDIRYIFVSSAGCTGDRFDIKCLNNVK